LFVERKGFEKLYVYYWSYVLFGDCSFVLYLVVLNRTPLYWHDPDVFPRLPTSRGSAVQMIDGNFEGVRAPE